MGPIRPQGRHHYESAPKASLRVLVVGAGVGGISIARGLLRDGHDVTVFEQRPEVRAGGGAVTIWSNGETGWRNSVSGWRARASSCPPCGS